MTTVWIVAIVFLASLVQCLSGFGFALIVMPLVTLIVGLQTAAPTVALTALTVYSINLVRYRRAIDVREVLHLGMSSALGVPLGIWVLTSVDETLVKQVMGVILIVYAAYALARPTALRKPSRYWVYPAGFFAGCLSGAYNTPGPPVILYGSLRQWPRDKFRAVLQAIFFINGALVVSSHVLADRVNREVFTFFVFAVPALMLGILVGSHLDRLVDRTRFRIIVASLVGLMGLALTLGLG
jgi:uncharacterized membrane protein YfcA